VTAAARLAHVEKDHEERWLEQKTSWREALFSRAGVAVSDWIAGHGPDRSAVRLVRRVTDPLQQELARVARFSEPMRAYAYCPCTLN
jgi:hypothetical protein